MRVVFPKKHIAEIKSVCEDTKIPHSLVLAIIKTESSFESSKISSKGAIGLMQIMPETANYVADLFFAGEEINLFDVKQNILIGVTYLVYLYKKFDNIKTVLAAYNAGEGRVNDWLKNTQYSLDGKTLIAIPFEETATYVKRVLLYQKFYKFLY